MVATPPTIPPELMARIKEFLLLRRNGQIVLNVQQGAIASADLCDTWRRGRFVGIATKDAPAGGIVDIEIGT